MTLEQDSKSEENCNLRSAKAGHSSNICLSSPELHKLQTRLARGRLKWRPSSMMVKPKSLPPITTDDTLPACVDRVPVLASPDGCDRR